ncbi:hypothetical protein MRB56_04385 [Halomonas cupida]
MSLHSACLADMDTSEANNTSINPACFHVGLMAAQERAAVGHQADARPDHTGADPRICASVVRTKIKSIRMSYLIAMLIAPTAQWSVTR